MSALMIDPTTERFRRPTEAGSSDSAAGVHKKPRLSLILQDKTKRRFPFWVIPAGIFLISCVLLLLLNIGLSQGAFQTGQLKVAQQETELQLQIVNEKIAPRRTPENLSKVAESLGMVPGVAPGYIRLESGQIIGDPKPAEGEPFPVDEKLLKENINEKQGQGLSLPGDEIEAPTFR